MLSPTHLRRLFGGLGEIWNLADFEEVTFEANPATFDAPKAALFRELGVTRVSLGIQSFDADVLATLGREHSPDQAAESIALLRDAGLPEVNIDLMFSIPGQSREVWESTLQRALACTPQHISAYNLSYEEDTAFFESLRKGEMHEDPDHDADFFTLAHQLLESAGFQHYETSNFALPGHESDHNRSYWAGEDYLGLGPSAVSTIDRLRLTNVADTAAYVARVASLGHALDASEIIDDEAWRLERIALGLRTHEGIPLSLLTPLALDRLPQLAEHGLLIADPGTGTLRLRGRGHSLVDAIAAELID